MRGYCGRLPTHWFYYFKMKDKLKKLIEEMDVSELKELKEDLDTGEYVKGIVGNKIKDIEEPKLNRCHICHNFIGKNNSRAYSLEFGSMEDKRKAHFCKYNCLRYFLTILEGKNS